MRLVTRQLVGYLVVSDGVPRPVQVIRHEVDEINCIAQAGYVQVFELNVYLWKQQWKGWG